MKLNYYKGSGSWGEHIEFHVTRGGKFIGTCDIKVSKLLAGEEKFKIYNGKTISPTVRLTPSQRLEILEFLQAERKKLTDVSGMKNLSGWINSGLKNFAEYFFPGDEVDKDVVDEIINSDPPTTLSLSCTQSGEPYSIVTDKDGISRAVYITFHSIGELRFVYDGLCFEGSNKNMVEKPDSILRIEKLMEEAKKECESGKAFGSGMSEKSRSSEPKRDR